MDNPQVTPSTDILTQKNYTMREWLMFYKNIWTRNLVARLVDVNTDIAGKKINAEEMVLCDDKQYRTVSERLELSKISVKKAKEILASINELMALNDVELVGRYSDVALAFTPDPSANVGAETEPADPKKEEVAQAPVAAVTPEVTPAPEVKPETV